HAGPVEIDQARVGMGVMDVLAGVLLEMDARQTHALLHAVQDELYGAADANRLLIHTDLVGLREVGIEVILARPAAGRRDATAGGEAGANREFDRLPIGYRQHAGKRHADRASVGIRRRAEFRRAGAEELRSGEKLRMDLETDDRLEAHRGASRVSP